MNQHQTSRVSMKSDTLDLTPAEYAALLATLSRRDDCRADSYGQGGSVAVLEQKIAALLGKSAAVAMPTGTMSNLLAIQWLTGAARRVVVQAQSHLYRDSGDCAQSLAGINLVPLGHSATISPPEFAAEIENSSQGKVATPLGAIVIETPVRRLDGEMFAFDAMTDICNLAKTHGIRRHLDGARLFVASVYSGHSIASFCEQFDTVYLSLYKNFNTLSGAILAGPEDLIEQLRHWRRRNGGGLAQWWPTATVALHFLDGYRQRLVDAAEIAESFYAQLARDERFWIEPVKNGSSVRYVGLTGNDAQKLQNFRSALRTQSIELPAADPGHGRFALKTNESWLRTDATQLCEQFQNAIAVA